MLSVDQQRALLQEADPILGRLNCAVELAQSLQALSYAAEVGDGTYLTLAGWTERDRISNTPVATMHGRFAAATGHGILHHREAHAAAARRAWQCTLELRRLTGTSRPRALGAEDAVDQVPPVAHEVSGAAPLESDGDVMAAPAPHEHQRAVHYVALALEAAGITPADIDERGRCLRTGYQVTEEARSPTAARVVWKRNPTDTVTSDVDHDLATCRTALAPRGWNTGRYLESGRPYLIAWPTGLPEPL